MPARRSCSAAPAAAAGGASAAVAASLPAAPATANVQCAARSLLCATLLSLYQHSADSWQQPLAEPGVHSLPGRGVAGVLSPPQVSVNFDDTTDHAVYRQVSSNGLSFKYDEPSTNPSFAATAYAGADPLAVTLPNYLRICHITPAPNPPVTIVASTRTFTLLSLYAANSNPQFSDLTSSDSVHFTGLLQGVAVPGCGAAAVTLPNGCANGINPCAATKVSFTGCEAIDALQVTVTTTNLNGYWCVALDLIVVQACSSDSSISATTPYVGTDPLGP